MGEQFWSVERVARELDISRAAVYRLVKSRGLPVHRLWKKRGFRFLPREVMAWLERCPEAQKENGED